MWTKKKKKRAINTLITYGSMHRSWFVRGVFGTVGVVFFRLLMPWPLRGVIELVFPRGSHKGRIMVEYLPSWGDPVLWLVAFYVLMAVGLGISEMIQRVNFKRFSSQTAHDMRAAAVRGVSAIPLRQRASTGDIIARIIGDSARIKAGLSGIMVHGLQNGLLFVLVTAVMFYVSIELGLIFFVAGLIAVFIGLTMADPVATTARKLRRKEGDYATAIQEGLESGFMNLQMDEINWSSARKEVRSTKLIARSTLYIHIVLALAVGLALWLGAYGVKTGHVAPGDLFIFILYAFTVHRRMVQVGRQLSRTGKVLACADRIGAYIRHDGSAEGGKVGVEAAVPLRSGLRLENVRLDSARGHKDRARLKRLDLLIEPGSRLAVIGNVGSGKSSLIQLLAGVEFPDKGKIFWDDTEVTRTDGILSSRVAYLPQEPVFPPTKVWKLLGLPRFQALSPEQEETLRRIGALRLAQGFQKGLDQKVGSNSISRNEARMLRLAGILLGDRSLVWVLDNPLPGLRGKKALRCLDEILRRAAERTVIISLPDPVHVSLFERLLLLHNGKVQFDGSPVGWKEWKVQQPQQDKQARTVK
ncbi:MAG: ABC transporter ATP-binding protein [Thermodesulfobacteriota bacterium]|nr:MAG: ABC transporter ATP-binding protein [Thermodesulfobacteriota bacterium]